jgi:hypothetical protein
VTITRISCAAALAAALLAPAARAAAPALTWLDDDAAVVAEYCRVGNPFSRDTCTVAKGTLVLIHVPEPLGRAIEAHLKEAFARGWYTSLSENDLFHGHVILGGPRLDYASPDDFFSDVKVLLYHADEGDGRRTPGDDEDKPWSQRPQRSFLGWPDGAAQTALSYVGPQAALPGYERSGTIYSDAIAASHPGLTADHLYGGGNNDDITVDVCRDGRCGPCHLNTMMMIAPASDGAWSAPDGVRYDAYFRCNFTDGAAEPAASIVDRPASVPWRGAGK